MRENLELGAYTRDKFKAEARADMEKAFTLFPRLKERENQLAGTLSGGEQQMLAIGRALMARPRLLLLDEPSLGLAPFLVKDIFRIIQDINQQGMTVLLVEQNANQALRIAHRGYVLETGRVVLADTACQSAAKRQCAESVPGRVDNPTIFRSLQLFHSMNIRHVNKYNSQTHRHPCKRPCMTRTSRSMGAW